MPLNLYYDKEGIIRLISKENIINTRYQKISKNIEYNMELIGKKIRFNQPKDFRLAVICNWNDQCGISTYSRYLLDELKHKVDHLKVFSEIKGGVSKDPNDDTDVEYTWKRATSMSETIKKVIEWNPTLVLIQHEFGIFPKASYFFTMMEMLSDIPTVLTLHSVYEHRDKSVCTSIIKNIVVHTKTGEHCLRETLGHKHQNIFVVPHGCVDFGDVKPNYNQFGVNYPIIQFGFGFNYKGVDTALEAIALLKQRSDKYKDIFYCYLCSESNHAKNTHAAYYRSIKDKIKELGLENNATIQRGFFSNEELNQFLKTARLSVFPYITDQKNVVYGASGAIRVAMANGNPVIASSSRMFDDMEGVLPRPSNAKELADEISKVFSDGNHKKKILENQRNYIQNNTWKITADRYMEIFKKVIDDHNKGVVIA